ncbi:hypothetical protein M422DRAFT_129160, partial [Sphaerobolus stellatus SS14]
LMHKIELGVWKALFTHFIRILYTCGTEVAHIFSLFPTENAVIPAVSGQSTIRQFASDVLEMRKLAAHDFKDILQ